MNVVDAGCSREKAQEVIHEERRRLHARGYDATKVTFMDGLGFASFVMNDYDYGRQMIEIYAQEETDAR